MDADTIQMVRELHDELTSTMQPYEYCKCDGCKSRRKVIKQSKKWLKKHEVKNG